MPTTLNSNALTTLDRVKTLLGRRTANDVNREQINWLINAASDIIEQFCNRSFSVQRYINEFSQSDAHGFLVKHYPVIDIESVHSLYTLVSASGTADSGTTTSLTDSALIQAEGYWIDADLLFTHAGKRYKRIVTGFDATTDALQFDKALPAAISAGDSYKLRLWQTSNLGLLNEDDYSVAKGDSGYVQTYASYGVVLVKYWAGYETVPDDLDFACANLVNHLMSEVSRPGLNAAASKFAVNDNYLLTVGNQAIDIDPKIKSILMRYRKRSLS